MTRWKIWIRTAAGKPWYAPVIDADGGDGSWESAEDAETIAQQFRLGASLPPTDAQLERFGISTDELAPADPQVIVLPSGEQPEDSLEVHTLANGQQLPRPRRPTG